MAVHRRYTPVVAYGGRDDLLTLFLRIRRLLRHPGYDRDEVVSPTLRRFLPAAGPRGAAWVEDGIRKRLDAAALDGPTVAYLIAAAEDELAAAHARG